MLSRRFVLTLICGLMSSKEKNWTVRSRLGILMLGGSQTKHSLA